MHREPRLDEESSTLPVTLAGVLPTGPMVVNLPKNFAAELARLAPNASLDMVGTRIWLQRVRDDYLLHVGDMEMEVDSEPL